jgi:hypothetical protein
MPNQYAPIAFFAYKRPEQTLSSLASLANNPESKQSWLFIFCDGPKTSSDEAGVREVRRVVRDRQWCGRVSVIEHERNQGLAQSVIGGVTQLVEEFGRVIVVEDDLLVARGFLDYANRALERYEHADKVFQISGHMFPIAQTGVENHAFFMPMITSWGWATWRRAWKYFDPGAEGFEQLKHDASLRKRFDLQGSYPYSTMLFSQMAGEIDSWAIRWWWSVFRQNGIALFPRRSLIRNIGSDAASTHTRGGDILYNDTRWSDDRRVGALPERVEVDRDYFGRVRTYLALATNRSPLFRARRRLIRLLRSVVSIDT